MSILILEWSHTEQIFGPKYRIVHILYKHLFTQYKRE